MNQIQPSWYHFIETTLDRKLQTSGKTTLPIIDKIFLLTLHGDLRARVWCGVIDNLSIPLLVTTAFTNHFLRQISWNFRTVTPCRPAPVPILQLSSTPTAIHGAKTKIGHAYTPHFGHRHESPIFCPAGAATVPPRRFPSCTFLFSQPHLNWCFTLLFQQDLILAANGIADINKAKPFFIKIKYLNSASIPL